MMSAEEERKKLLTVKEVAAILRVNTDSVYEFIKAKKLAAVRIGTIKIRPEALEDFIKAPRFSLETERVCKLVGYYVKSCKW